MTHFKVEVESLDTSSRESQGWLTGYNIRHNYSSPWRLSEAIGGHEYLVKALDEYAEKTSISLGKIYEKSTVFVSFSSLHFTQSDEVEKKQTEVLTEYGLLMGANFELFLCFCDFQVDEWIEQNVYPLQDKTMNLLKLIDQLTARRTWPRRPIP